MALTQNATRVRVESAAKNGTLGSQAGANADQIILDTNVSTNNGNLEASPTLNARHIILRRGETDEECGLVKSVSGGTTCTMYTEWDAAPASGDTYDVGYIPEDLATMAGCDFETDSRQWVMTKRLIVGVGTTTFGMLGVSRGRILRLDDRGPTQSALLINTAGWFLIGTMKDKPNGDSVAERGGVLIFTQDGSDELGMEIEGNARMYEFGMYGARSHEGVTGTDVTVDVGATVKWSRFQGAGMDTPFKKKQKRYKDVAGDILINVTDIKASEAYKGWLKSELDQTIVDYIAAEAGINEVCIVIEEE